MYKNLESWIDFGQGVVSEFSDKMRKEANSKGKNKMKINEFYKMIQQKPIILDGATGTNLQKAGMPVGVCPEQWILENPDIMIKLQEDYVAAGTDILYAPTFTANRIKLEEYGLADR